jgi:hypothetical protein
VDDYRLTKRSSKRAAVRALIKAQALRVLAQHVAQRGGPFKMHLENGPTQQQRTSPPRADPSSQLG